MATPPLFHVPADRLDGAAPGAATVTLDGAEGRHAARVRRIRAGERVRLGDGAGLVADCEVTAAGPDTLTCAVLDVVRVPAPEPWLVVVQALAKGDRAEQAIETMTEAGVDEIVPWEAARSVVRWRGDRAAKSLARWRTTAAEAAKQARRARTPVVAGPASTGDVAGRLAAAALALVLDGGGDGAAGGAGDEGVPPAAVDVPAAGEVVLVVGPEGGVAPAERETFLSVGARSLRLGPTVLRSATAGTVGAAALLARTSRWT